MRTITKLFQWGLTLSIMICQLHNNSIVRQYLPGETLETFSSTGAIQTWSIPVDVTSFTVCATCADGGNTVTPIDQTGGAVATVCGTCTVSRQMRLN